MTRIIHFTGALLGTLIGFALGLALLQRAGGLIEEANRPAFLTAFVAATLLFGYLAIPYITIYPRVAPSRRSAKPGPASSRSALGQSSSGS